MPASSVALGETTIPPLAILTWAPMMRAPAKNIATVPNSPVTSQTNYNVNGTRLSMVITASFSALFASEKCGSSIARIPLPVIASIEFGPSM
jgi:hypothetical protein